MTIQPLSPAAAGSLPIGPASSRRSASPSKLATRVKQQQVVDASAANPAKKRKLEPASAVSKRTPSGSAPTTARSKQRAAPHDLCAFCLRTAGHPKGDTPKLLVSCHECGSSGHPSCLKWGRNPTKVRQALSYDWRCIECKKCEVCRDKGDDVSIDAAKTARTRAIESRGLHMQVPVRSHFMTAQTVLLTLLSFFRPLDRLNSCFVTSAIEAGICIACRLHSRSLQKDNGIVRRANPTTRLRRGRQQHHLHHSLWHHQ